MVSEAQFQKSAAHHDRMNALMGRCLKPIVFALAVVSLFVVMALIIMSMHAVAYVAHTIATHPIQTYAEFVFSWGWRLSVAIFVAAVLVGSVIHIWIDLTWPRS